jgi:hypothetical protein
MSMGIEVRCECGHLFEADGRFAGGIVNCPRCGHAAPVAGLRDPAWRILLVLGFIFWAGGTVLAGLIWGLGAALAAAVGIALLL